MSPGPIRLIADAIDELLAKTRELAEFEFGQDAVPLPAAGMQLTGQDGSTLLVPANDRSVGLRIAVPNTIHQVVFLASGDGPAIVDKGNSLIPGGDPTTILAGPSQFALYGITTAAGATIAWQQFVMPEPEE